jgi:hypothetical protein
VFTTHHALKFLYQQDQTLSSNIQEISNQNITCLTTTTTSFVHFHLHYFMSKRIEYSVNLKKQYYVSKKILCSSHYAHTLWSCCHHLTVLISLSCHCILLLFSVSFSISVSIHFFISLFLHCLSLSLSVIVLLMKSLINDDIVFWLITCHINK